MVRRARRLALSRGLGHADVRDPAGADPRTVVTTTPRPAKLIRDLVRDPICVVTRGSSYENRRNLAPAFFEQIIRKYQGTRLGRQELPGVFDGRRIDPRASRL
jgi:phage terminase large subunit-like protein